MGKKAELKAQLREAEAYIRDLEDVIDGLRVDVKHWKRAAGGNTPSPDDLQ